MKKCTLPNVGYLEKRFVEYIFDLAIYNIPLSLEQAVDSKEHICKCIFHIHMLTLSRNISRIILHSQEESLEKSLTPSDLASVLNVHEKYFACTTQVSKLIWSFKSTLCGFKEHHQFTLLHKNIGTR